MIHQNNISAPEQIVELPSNGNNSLIKYTLHLADSSLIMGHRLSEWAAHGPTLEQDIAISNIALDLIGQSRNFYQYAALISGDGHSEDSLAYLRDANDFKNLLINELPNGDWAHTTLKIFFFSNFQSLLYNKMIGSSDKQLAAIAEKSLKEVTYHLRWSSEWIIRLGDGTDESHLRIQKALNDLYAYTSEMFEMEDFENSLLSSNVSIDVKTLQQSWNEKNQDIFNEASLIITNTAPHPQKGKQGKHTEHLQLILDEMQELQRKYPGLEW